MLIADVDGKSGQVAAGDLPLVVLLGEGRPDGPADRSPVREDAHDVGAPPYLLVEAFLGVVRPDPASNAPRGNAVKAKTYSPASSSVTAAWGKRSSSMPTMRRCCAWNSSGEGCW